MSKVLDRLRAQQKLKKADTPDVSADQYLADLKRTAYTTAQADILSNLVSSAEEAEVDSYKEKLEQYEKRMELMDKAHESTKSLLAKRDDEVSRLSNVINSLNQEAKEYEITIEKLKNEQALLMREQANMEQTYKNTLSLLEKKLSNVPQPVIHQPPVQFPEIEFIPIRGSDGRTVSVTAKPRTN